MGKFKEQSTDWSEHPKQRTENIKVIAKYTDELEYTIYQYLVTKVVLL